MNQIPLTAGFANPVADAQACFRAVLDAMAHPGRVQAVPSLVAPWPLCNAAAAVLLTLTDHETALWLDPDAEPARPWISFHCGAPFTPAAQAMFCLMLALPDLTELRTGTDETPETAATVILQVASLSSGRGFSLQGPACASLVASPSTVCRQTSPRSGRAITAFSPAAST